MTGDLKSTQLADLHVPVRIGGDGSAKGIMKEVTFGRHWPRIHLFQNGRLNEFEVSLDLQWEQIVEDSVLKLRTIQK